MKTSIYIGAFYLCILCSCKNSQPEHTSDNNNIESNSSTYQKQELTIPYTQEDTTSINEEIRKYNIRNLEKTANIYYADKVVKEEGETVSLFPDPEKNPPRITILHENIPDDSLRGIKTILIFTPDLSKVIEIRKSIRCWTGRGHGSWSSEPCL